MDKLKISNYLLENSEEIRKIEKIIHPMVIKYIVENSVEGINFIESAIAKKSGLDKMGVVWYVNAPNTDRILRLKKYRSIDEKIAKKILNSQIEEKQLYNSADEVIENPNDKEVIEDVERLIKKYENL